MNGSESTSSKVETWTNPLQSKALRMSGIKERVYAGCKFNKQNNYTSDKLGGNNPLNQVISCIKNQ